MDADGKDLKEVGRKEAPVEGGRVVWRPKQAGLRAGGENHRPAALSRAPAPAGPVC